MTFDYDIDQSIFDVPLEQIEFGSALSANEWVPGDKVVYPDLVVALALAKSKCYRPFVQVTWSKLLCHRHWVFCRAARDAGLSTIWCDVDDDVLAAARGLLPVSFDDSAGIIRWFFFIDGPITIPSHPFTVRTITHRQASCLEVIVPIRAEAVFKEFRSALRLHNRVRSIDGVRTSG